MIFKKIDQYKAQIEDLRPFEGDMLKQIKDYYKILLTYSSGAMEGNKLTETEVKILLEEHLTVGEKSKWDYYEAIGHARAYDYLYTIDKNDAIGEEHIKTMQRLLYSQVDAEQNGFYRQKHVRITDSRYATPTPDKIASLMSNFTDWLVRNEGQLHPVEFAAQAHKKLLFIWPFFVGNRRVAILLMNLCLIRKGYSMAIIPPTLRSKYIMLLEKAHEDDKPFIDFIAERVEESQRDLIRLLK